MISSVLLPILISSPPEIIIDLGSGAGRDVCFLAESLSTVLPTTTIIGVDKHKGSQRRSTPLWTKRGVSNNTRHALLDLKKIPLFDEYVGALPSHVGCAYAVRYLNRALFNHLSGAMEVGSIFALSHFVRNLDGTFPYDHPSLSDVLDLGEMEGIFRVGDEEGGGEWEVLCNNRVKDSDAGRTLLNFVVKRIRK